MRIDDDDDRDKLTREIAAEIAAAIREATGESADHENDGPHESGADHARLRFSDACAQTKYRIV